MINFTRLKNIISVSENNLNHKAIKKIIEYKIVLK